MTFLLRTSLLTLICHSLLDRQSGSDAATEGLLGTCQNIGATASQQLLVGCKLKFVQYCREFLRYMILTVRAFPMVKDGG